MIYNIQSCNIVQYYSFMSSGKRSLQGLCFVPPADPNPCRQPKRALAEERAEQQRREEAENQSLRRRIEKLKKRTLASKPPRADIPRRALVDKDPQGGRSKLLCIVPRTPYTQPCPTPAFIRPCFYLYLHPHFFLSTSIILSASRSISTFMSVYIYIYMHIYISLNAYICS